MRQPAPRSKQPACTHTQPRETATQGPHKRKDKEEGNKTKSGPGRVEKGTRNKRSLQLAREKGRWVRTVSRGGLIPSRGGLVARSRICTSVVKESGLSDEKIISRTAHHEREAGGERGNPGRFGFRDRFTLSGCRFASRFFGSRFSVLGCRARVYVVRIPIRFRISFRFASFRFVSFSTQASSCLRSGGPGADSS